MTPERWRQVTEVFHAARSRDTAARVPYLDDACAGDRALRDEVNAMLDAHHDPGSFGDRPVSTSIDELPRLETGAMVGSYRIDRLIGAGGMGEVYRARDTKLNRDVALKIQPDLFALDRDRLARFEREAQVLASLNHPNIAAIYGFEDESNGVQALVLELVEGPTLADRLAEGRIPLDEALPIARQICEALEAAHEQGIIHRDLKPANVKVRPDGAVKVLDFGLAKLTGPAEAALGRDFSPADVSNAPTMMASIPGMILGTAAYMSPEQAKGREADKRSDIWAFGCVLYEMVTGKRPFDGEDVADVLVAVLSKQPDWSVLPAKTPTRLRELLQRCLVKEPHSRVRDIGDARIVIEEAQSGAAGDGHVVPPGASRWRERLAWASGLTLVTLMAAVALWTPWRRPLSIAQPALRLDVDLGLDVQLLPATGPGAILSPDGTRLVVVAQATGGKSRLLTRRLDQTKATEMVGTVGGYGPFFSPDGQWVGFFADGKMKKIRVDGGDAITLCDAPAGRGASWGDDDRIIAALDTNSGLSGVPSSGGPAVAVTQLHGEVQVSGGHRWPQVLPGHKAVLFTTSPSFDYREAVIVAASLQDGHTTIVHAGMFARYLPGGYLVYISKGTLFGVRFDPDRLEVRGAPVALLEQVSYRPTGGSAVFDFSQNGTALYESGAAKGLQTIQWLDADGKSEPLLSSEALYLFPRQSPDGGRLAATLSEGGTTDIWVYDLRRDIPTRLTTGPGANTHPTWSPDGQYVVFRSANGMSWTRADGAGSPQPLTTSPLRQLPTSFTPDGTRLVFLEQDPVTGSEIRTIPVQSNGGQLRAGKPELFLRLPSGNAWPAFSPDGHWIAYASTESGGYEVYVRSFPDSGARWRISNSGGTLPVWSRNGRELFYRADDQRIMVARYSVNRGAFIADKPALWSTTRLANTGVNPSFDLASDGKRVVAIMPAEIPEASDSRSHVTLFLNFFDELRRRVPVGP